MDRRCPCCAVPLEVGPLGGEQVDRCARCGGIYFDAGELEALVELVRWYGAVELPEPDLDSGWEQEPTRGLACPADGQVMEKHDLGGLVLDKCPRCDGIWLDDGEIAALRTAQAHVRDNAGLYLRLGC